MKERGSWSHTYSFQEPVIETPDFSSQFLLIACKRNSVVPSIILCYLGLTLYQISGLFQFLGMHVKQSSFRLFFHLLVRGGECQGTVVFICDTNSLEFYSERGCRRKGPDLCQLSPKLHDYIWSIIHSLLKKN